MEQHDLIVGTAILAPTILTTFIATTVLFLSQMRRKGCLETMHNKFIIVVSTGGLFLTLSFCSLAVGIWIDGEKRKIIDSLESASFVVAIFLHMVALYFRTSAVIVGEKSMKAIRFILPIFLMSGLSSSVSRLLPQVISVLVTLSFASCFLLLDSIFTFSFIRFVHMAGNTLGKSSIEKTMLVAREGLKMSIISWMGAAIYIASKVTTNPQADFYCYVVSRIFPTIAVVIWVSLKKQLDTTPVKNSSTA